MYLVGNLQLFFQRIPLICYKMSYNSKTKSSPSVLRAQSHIIACFFTHKSAKKNVVFAFYIEFFKVERPREVKVFSNLFLQVSTYQLFVPIGILIVPICTRSEKQVKKAFCFKNCSVLSLF